MKGSLPSKERLETLLVLVQTTSTSSSNDPAQPQGKSVWRMAVFLSCFRFLSIRHCSKRCCISTKEHAHRHIQDTRTLTDTPHTHSGALWHSSGWALKQLSSTQACQLALHLEDPSNRTFWPILSARSLSLLWPRHGCGGHTFESCRPQSFVARCDSCQTSTRNASTETFSVDLYIRAPCQIQVFGGVQSWSLHSENCLENVDATPEKKFRNLNEKMWPQASKKFRDLNEKMWQKWPEKWPRSFRENRRRENASKAVKQQENIERGGALAFLTILSPRWLRVNVFWARPIFSTMSQFENGPPFRFFVCFPERFFFCPAMCGPKILTCFRIPMWEGMTLKIRKQCFQHAASTHRWGSSNSCPN